MRQGPYHEKKKRFGYHVVLNSTEIQADITNDNSFRTEEAIYLCWVFLKIQINFSHIYVKCYMGNIKVETKHDLRYLEIIINILHKKEKKKRLTNTSTSHNKGFHIFFVKIFCLSVK